MHWTITWKPIIASWWQVQSTSRSLSWELTTLHLSFLGLSCFVNVVGSARHNFEKCAAQKVTMPIIPLVTLCIITIAGCDVWRSLLCSTSNTVSLCGPLATGSSVLELFFTTTETDPSKFTLPSSSSGCQIHRAPVAFELPAYSTDRLKLSIRTSWTSKVPIIENHVIVMHAILIIHCILRITWSWKLLLLFSMVNVALNFWLRGPTLNVNTEEFSTDNGV